MQFKLSPVTAADLEAAKTYYGPETADLAAAALANCWPLDAGDVDGARRRAEWSCLQQLDVLKADPSTRLVKVTDTDAKPGQEIVALGRWHEYPNGYEQYGDLELTGLTDRNDTVWPPGLNKELYLGMLDEIFAARRGWLVEGWSCWVLTNIVTRETYRRQGAGSMILQWGLQQARKAKVPAYLEAAATAKHLYESHGFREVKPLAIDCDVYGVQGLMLELSQMKADP